MNYSSRGTPFLLSVRLSRSKLAQGQAAGSDVIYYPTVREYHAGSKDIWKDELETVHAFTVICKQPTATTPYTHFFFHKSFPCVQWFVPLHIWSSKSFENGSNASQGQVCAVRRHCRFDQCQRSRAIFVSGIHLCTKAEKRGRRGTHPTGQGVNRN